MVNRPIRIFRANSIALAETAVAVVPVGKTWILTYIHMASTATGTPVNVNIRVEGATVIREHPIEPRGLLVIETKLVIPEGGTVTVWGSISNCAIHLSGVEMNA